MTDADAAAPHPRCRRCLRPQRMCRCASLPTVPTRTRIVLLQHPHERRHPFGTARLLALSLPNAELHVAYGGLSGLPLVAAPVPADAAVLFPSQDAVDLASLPPAERPHTLVVIDGTWAHAKRLHRVNPWLHGLRHVRLHPDTPSRYRIRREPRADYVSTLEAVVLALSALEPDNTAVARLLLAFDAMVDQQIAHVASVRRQGRSKRPRQRQVRMLSPLLGDPRLVVAYAETSLPGGDADAERELVQWAAVRLADGATFDAVLRPHGPGPGAAHLAHMGLSAADLAAGEPPAAARARFQAFAGAGAPVAAWTETSLTWGAPLLGDAPRTVLKTAYCNVHHGRAGLIEQVVAREGLAAAPVACRGRAAGRLGNAVAVARWLAARRAALHASPPSDDDGRWRSAPRPDPMPR
ncbi:MAG: DTW domain-containing protein [Planctomycetes bacterium]|nr:DTW domain-containing protein [Planctomycetota bacterium]